MSAPQDGCARFRDQLCGFVDETLTPKRWDEVGCHVAGCPACRAEVIGLRQVRAELNSCFQEAVPSGNLAARLEQIAGERSNDPLYLAQGPATKLPSKRRARNRRLAQAGVSAVAMAVVFVMVAMLVAPDAPIVSSPVRDAQEQYSLSVTTNSLGEEVGAALFAHSKGAELSELTFLSPRQLHTNLADPIDSTQAEELISAADESALTLSGIQQVWITDGEGAFQTMAVQRNQVAGEGATLVVEDTEGRSYVSWFVPEQACCSSVAPEPWNFFRYEGSQELLGRSAMIIEAQQNGGQVAARWWVDEQTGLILWFERYSKGELEIVSGFVELHLGKANLERGQSLLVTMNVVGPAGNSEWCQGLAECPESLAGLPLVAFSISDDAGPRAMRLLYSDGFRHLSLQWTPGRLPEGSARQTSAVLPSVSVWQSGDGVISVATGSDDSLLDAAVKELPSETEYRRSPWDRLLAGIERLTGVS